MYLRGFASDIPGVPVVSVDYSLSPQAKFPVAIQEVLDTYLWLMKGDESVQEALGFKPESVVLCGDSCGGLFSAILMVLLADIRKKFDEPIKSPKALVSFYATFTVCPFMSPGMLLCPSHAYLLPTIFLACMQSYVLENMDGLEHLHDEEFEVLNDTAASDSTWARFKNWMSENFNWYFWWRPMERIRPSNLWFLKGKDIIRRKIVNNNGLMTHPYMSPLMYDDFEALKQTNLYIIALANDPIIDHSIMMARKWKGRVQLDVIDQLVHAFLNMYYVNDSYRQGYQLCVNRLRDAVYD